jgi:hypothetical protein
MVKRRLSQVLGAIEKGWGVDTFEGPFPIVQFIKNPAVADNTGVHAAVTLSASAEQTIDTGMTNPDVYRTIRLVGNQATVSGIVTLRGTDWAGRIITEDVLVTGTVAVDSNQAFKEIRNATFPVRQAASDSISLGLGADLGLIRPLAAGLTDLDVVELANHTVDAPSNVNATYATFIPGTTPNGSHDYFVYYKTDLF